TQADDSESECDKQVILVPSFPSNSFLGPTVHDVSAPMENNSDYAEELARLQRQEYEAHSAAAKQGFEFFVDTAAMLPQAKIEIRRNLVPATGDPAGSIVFTGDVSAGSVPTSGVPAGILAGSIVFTGGVPASGVPAGSVPAGGVLAVSIVSAEFSDPANPAGSIVFTGDVSAGSVPTSGVPAGSVLASSVPADGVLAGSIVFTGGVPASGVPAGSVPAGGVLVVSIVSAEFSDPAGSASIPAVLTNAPAATSPLPPGHSLGSCKHTTRFPSLSDLGNHQPTAGIFSSSSYDVDFCADVTNLASTVAIDPVATKRVAAMQEEMQQFYNHQDKYVKDILKKFDMESVRTATTPYEVPKHKSKDDPDDAVNVHLFRSMIGSLMYLTASRPDIMFAVSACSRHQCKKQKVIATSSTEAEYVAAACCCGQELYIILLFCLVSAETIFLCQESLT
nr:hypothetical protein [Tanacetum cinerariifolium]